MVKINIIGNANLMNILPLFEGKHVRANLVSGHPTEMLLPLGSSFSAVSTNIRCYYRWNKPV